MYKSTGFISFVLRRFTGVALVLYLFTHMWVIGSANSGPEVFDARRGSVERRGTVTGRRSVRAHRCGQVQDVPQEGQ